MQINVGFFSISSTGNPTIVTIYALHSSMRWLCENAIASHRTVLHRKGDSALNFPHFRFFNGWFKNQFIFCFMCGKSFVIHKSKLNIKRNECAVEHNQTNKLCENMTQTVFRNLRVEITVKNEKKVCEIQTNLKWENTESIHNAVTLIWRKKISTHFSAWHFDYVWVLCAFSNLFFLYPNAIFSKWVDCPLKRLIRPLLLCMCVLFSYSFTLCHYGLCVYIYI